MTFLELMNELAARPSNDAAEDLRRARDAFVRRTGRIAESELSAFGSLVADLLPKVALIERMAFARQVASNRNMPRSLLTKILDDNYLVSAPVLESAPLLDEKEILEVIERQGAAVCLAISKRENLSMQLTDRLMASSELKVQQALAGNSSARLSRKSFAELCELAEREPSILEKLARRRDLPMSLAARLRSIGKPYAPATAVSGSPDKASSDTAGAGRGSVVLPANMVDGQRPRRTGVKTIRYS